ncbi:MAG: hypothetical protein RSD71_17725, partial [Flavobacterium sp.]
MIQNVNKSNTIGFCFFILITLLLWFPAKLKAQEQQLARITSDLIFQAENSAFIPLVGGTKVTALSADSGVSTALPIGFTFNTGREDHTTFYASSNGHITFKAGIMGAFSAAPTGNTLVLAPLTADLSGVGGTFSYQTSGVAPNRVLTAEWKGWRWAYNSNTNVISFQVKMYEGTNTVEYIYDQGVNLPNSNSPAAIGIYLGKEVLYGETAAQLWLTSSGINPATSEVFVNTITSRPASGQLYRFINKSTIIGYFGQTVINTPGGTNSNDGIRLNISGAGNMQIIRKNTGQIYTPSNSLLVGTTKPFDVPGSTHGLALSIGRDIFKSGTLSPTGSVGDKNLVPLTSTQQSLIESTPGHFENTIKMKAEKNGLTYFLDVKYTYNYPDPSITIDYKVTIPPGNTDKVQLAHGWDTYLSGGDSGPGFVRGTAPNYVMGVFKQASSSYEAFQYKSGVAWSGYFSADYKLLVSNLNRGTATYMAFGNL